MEVADEMEVGVGEGVVEEDPLRPTMEEVVEGLVGGHCLVLIVVERVVEVL